MYEESDRFKSQDGSSRYYGRAKENGPPVSEYAVQYQCPDHTRKRQKANIEFDAFAGAGTTPFDVEVDDPPYNCKKKWDGNADVRHRSYGFLIK